MAGIIIAMALLISGMEAQISIESCSSNPQGNKINIVEFDVNPHPVHIPGSITIGGTIEVKEDMNDRVIAGDVKISRKTFWFFDVPFPCIDSSRTAGLKLGSCHYNNLCQLMDLARHGSDECPSWFSGHPCHCPVTKGVYKFNPFTVDIPKLPSVLNLFKKGIYNANLRLYDDVTSEELMCYRIKLRVA